MNILITGDTHSHVADRLSNIDTTKYPSEDTAVIILGDMGLNFFLNTSKNDDIQKRWASSTGFTIYAVRGNHEERPENLDDIERWYDQAIEGEVWRQPRYPNIRYLMDGGIYNFNGHRTLVIGGAYSVDKYKRLSKYHNDQSEWTGWFPGEQLTQQEMNSIFQKVEGQEFDFVLTHTCPIAWEPTDLFIGGIDQSTVDKTMENFLDTIRQNIKFKIWCFGHYHQDRLERPGVEQYYHDIEDIETVYDRWNNQSELPWWLIKSPNYYMEDVNDNS